MSAARKDAAKKDGELSRGGRGASFEWESRKQGSHLQVVRSGAEYGVHVIGTFYLYLRITYRKLLSSDPSTS